MYGAPETPETTDDPASLDRRIDRVHQRLMTYAGQPLVQQIQSRCLQRHRQVLGEGVVGVDDVVGAEGVHVGLDIVRIGAADHLDARAQQLAGNGDLQVDLVEIGQRHHGLAARMLQPRLDQVHRQ